MPPNRKPAQPVSLTKALYLAGLQVLPAVAVIGYAIVSFFPYEFHSVVVPAAKQVLVGGTAAGGLLLLWPRRRTPGPTWEDKATGCYVTGLSRSGKTAWAYLELRDFAHQGFGFVWLSIKSSLSLLPYLPAESASRVHVFAPYSDHPKGLNFLRCYTTDSTEREMLADQTAELFTRLHPHMSVNMRELIRMGALALLLWADQFGEEISLFECYRFFQEPSFRETVLTRAPKEIRDAFSSDEVRKNTLVAVRGQLRRSVTSENLLVALAQRDGLDLWEIMRDEQILVCDTPSAVLGPGVASFLCQMVASRLQMLTFKRSPGSRPFAIAADEFQRYTNPSFAHGVETAGEYGVCWMLIHQTNEGQDLGKEVKGAVNQCGNQIYFCQAPGADCKRAAGVLGNQWEPEEFGRLPKRHYRSRRRIQGQVVYEAGVTPLLPPPDEDLAARILAHANAGPSRAEILQAIRRRRVGSRT